jgi:dipeptidyl-peptidase-3
MNQNEFNYSDERFADLQLLRYRINGFEELTLQQKLYVYCLAKASLYGRDITTDQQGRYNLCIREMLEAVYILYKGDRTTADFKAFEVYLKRVWFSNGIYHHYGCEKMKPEFSEDFLKAQKDLVMSSERFRELAERAQTTFEELCDIIFNPDILPKRVNKADGEDLVVTSACNFYEGVNQEEVEAFYGQMKTDEAEPPSWGLNSTVVKTASGEIKEDVWKVDGRYGKAISKIVYWLRKASEYAESEGQKEVIDLLIRYYETGDLRLFDEYSIKWVKTHDGLIDFINGFIEVYGDPLGMKATWEGIVEIKDMEATRRTQAISSNAQWFEDHSPVAPEYRKPVVKGVTAHVVQAAILGGEEYPSTAIGINLPNADWIRAEYGSKSVTISNLTEAYDGAAKGNGFDREFICDDDVLEHVRRWGHITDDLHTDLHECLGHGSGRLRQGVDPDALKAYGNTIEEARADLFGLYYIADAKMLELGILTDAKAYEAQYYKYMMNGLMTQLVRIAPGRQIEEAHMRNRALIAHWVLENGDGVVELVKQDGKTYVRVNDYQRLRSCFAKLLAEIQRIKSEGDYDAARQLVERYAITIDPVLHEEMLQRYKSLDIAPYKGFINPRYTLVRDAKGIITDVSIDYTEGYAEQMLRYSRDYFAK